MLFTTICSRTDSQSCNPRGPTAVIHSVAFTILVSGSIFPQQEDNSNSTHSLIEVHGVEFGMNEQQVVERMNNRFKDPPVNEIMSKNYTVIEFRGVKSEKIQSNKLRFFLAPERGVFQIDEVYVLRWDLQRPDRDNLEDHRQRLNQLLRKLRKEYGREALLETTDLESRFRQEDFVTASWTFADNRWVHLIYEPQDWSIFREMNKIIVSYRDASTDPRSR